LSYLESTLKSELAAAFEKAGCIAWKFPDLSRGVLKPCDLVLGVNGKLVAVETKLRKVAGEEGDWKAERVVVTHKDMRPNQFLSMSKVEKATCLAYVGGALYDPETCKRTTWFIPHGAFILRERWTVADCRADPLVIEARWRRGQGWDVEPLIARIGTEIATI